MLAPLELPTGAHRLPAMQPVSWSRSLARAGIWGLVVATLTLAGCNSNVPVPLGGPLLTVELRGGMCPGGPCDSGVILDHDGRVRAAAKPPNDLGQVDAKAMAALTAALQATDFAAIRSQRFTGECPIAFDGVELTFEFNVGTGTQRIASCEVDIDWGHPLFVALGVAIGKWVPLPLT
jgi:hypothetical protein